jgi:hypothetical protein
LPEITEEMDFVSCPPAPATSADTRTCAKSKGESTAIRDHQMITTMTLCKKKEKHQHSLWLAVWLACRTKDFWIDSSMNFPNKLRCTIHVLLRVVVHHRPRALEKLLRRNLNLLYLPLIIPYVIRKLSKA